MGITAPFASREMWPIEQVSSTGNPETAIKWKFIEVGD
jgi:hypothetical protein